MSAKPIHLQSFAASVMCGATSPSVSDDLDEATCVECMLALQREIGDHMVNALRGGHLRLNAVAARIAEVCK